jgi:polysaccharide export outer membrane protein
VLKWGLGCELRCASARGGVEARGGAKRFPRWIYASIALLTPYWLAACSTLPNSGPLAVEVVQEEDAVPGNFIVVDVDERVASIWAKQPKDTLRVFGDIRPAPDIRIGRGDSVQVTIWEAASGGLFSASPLDRTASAGSRTATIPEQVVRFRFPMPDASG